MEIENLEKFNESIAQIKENLEAIQRYIINTISIKTQEKTPDESIFKASLTQLEQIAFAAIKENINKGEGSISYL